MQCTKVVRTELEQCGTFQCIAMQDSVTAKTRCNHKRLQSRLLRAWLVACFGRALRGDSISHDLVFLDCKAVGYNRSLEFALEEMNDLQICTPSQHDHHHNRYCRRQDDQRTDRCRCIVNKSLRPSWSENT